MEYDDYTIMKYYFPAFGKNPAERPLSSNLKSLRRNL
jgi:hypothetical protein